MWFDRKFIQLVNIIFQPFAVFYVLWSFYNLIGFLIRILKQLNNNNQVLLIGKLALYINLERK